MILGGDIGGTKTHLALFEVQGEILSLKEHQRYPSQDHSSLDEIVQDFLTQHSSKIEGAAFGIAGPVNQEEVQATNLPWDVKASNLQKMTEAPTHLINDLEANAWGIAILKPEEFCTLQKGSSSQNGNQALISAGTGLGEAGLYYEDSKHLPFACEGGHVDFAPRNAQEIRLLEYLIEKFGHVSYERVLSGQGLHNLYQFLLADKKIAPSQEIQNEMSQKDPAYVISEHAINQTDTLCKEALDLMTSLYGAAAGNLALKFMATGGVFIGGGIAPKILDQLKSPLFLEAFKAKGRLADLMENFSIQVLLNDEAALLGAGQCALHRLKKQTR